MKNRTPDVPLEEYAFNSFIGSKPPNEDLIACWIYEISRELHLRYDYKHLGWIEKSRNAYFNQSDSFESRLKKIIFSKLVEEENPRRLFIAYWSEWPEKPYLSIPAKVRSERRDLAIKAGINLVETKWDCFKDR